MSPSAWDRASFHTMETVPAGSLTAIRGKSLAGNRLYPGTNAPLMDTIPTDAVAEGPLHAGPGKVRHAARTRLNTSRVGVCRHVGGPNTLVNELNSYATYTSPVARSTAG